MPRLTLTLAQTALLLVMLPLLFDIILLASLMSMVLSAEQLATAAEHAREVTAQAETLFEHLSEASLATGSNRRSQNLLGFANVKSRVEEDITKLGRLTRSNRQEIENVSRVQGTANQLVVLLQRERGRIQNNSYEFPLGYSLPRQQLTAMLTLLRERIDRLYPAEQRKAMTEAAFASREKIKIAIIGGFMLNVILGVSLTIYFNRSTARRLRALMNNTVSLAKREELAPLIGGHDEIGNLDVTFHEMARSLKEAEKLRSDFTAMIVHDVRSPLATIRMFLDLVATDFYGPTPQAQRDQAIKLQRLTDRLLVLIDDILSLERLTAGEMPLELEDLDFQTIIDDAVHAVSGGSSQVKITTDVKLEAPNVIADSKQMTRVLANVLSNAIKFSAPDETVKLTVIQDTDTIRVEVEDRGPGVPNEQKSQIFEKYKQTRTAKKKEGTGLGLAICHRIIERHGGEIGVRDAQPHGSIFWFHIPRHGKTEEGQDHSQSSGKEKPPVQTS